jgi:crotonobetainyl-CoA:carnitine CoA-transferase CaiB-like acyl-CoA transferase
MRMSKTDKPTPLPVQAIDMATGYLLAAAVLRALNNQRTSGVVQSARLSLARVAGLLGTSARDHLGPGIAPETENDLAANIEHTDWGPVARQSG